MAHQAPNSDIEQAFKDFYPLLVNFALRYIPDLDSSKDIAQQVFINYYEKQAEIQINTSLKNYLLRATKNACINHLKQQQSQRQHHELIGQSINPYTEIEVEKEENSQFKRLFQAIEKLPERCQEIFKMNRLEGLRNQEIAEILGLSIRTVETQISKALKNLRGSLRK